MNISKIMKESKNLDNNKVICVVRAYFSGGVSTVIKCTEKDLFEIKSLNYNYQVI